MFHHAQGTIQKAHEVTKQRRSVRGEGVERRVSTVGQLLSGDALIGAAKPLFAPSLDSSDTHEVVSPLSFISCGRRRGRVRRGAEGSEGQGQR